MIRERRPVEHPQSWHVIRLEARLVAARAGMECRDRPRFRIGSRMTGGLMEGNYADRDGFPQRKRAGSGPVRLLV
ncbi:hypothetical protein GCM10022420_069660 [Streptomyces iranensis]